MEQQESRQTLVSPSVDEMKETKYFSIDTVEDVNDDELILVVKHLLRTCFNKQSSNQIESEDSIMTIDFKNDGDLIYLVGNSKNDIASSAYLYSYRGIESSPSSAFDLDEEKEVLDVIAKLVSNKAIQSAHRLSKGGLFVALAESAMLRGLGFSIKTNSAFRKDAFLFGETQSRFLVSIAHEKHNIFEAIIAETDVKSSFLGKVKKENFVVDSDIIISTAEAKALSIL